MANDTIIYNEVFDLYQIIAAPLIATIDADFYAAKRFVEYIREFGFVKEDKQKDKDYWGKLKTIRFKYYTTNPQGIVIEHSIELPILTLIPLPLLQVKSATFDMDIRLIGTMTEVLKDGDPPPSLIPSIGESANATSQTSKLQATLTSLNQKDNNELAPNLAANLKVHLIMQQADLPGGLAKLLNIAQDANQGNVIVLRDLITVNPSSLELDNRTPAEIIITLTDYSGLPVNNKNIQTKIESDKKYLELIPSQIRTNPDGTAIFKVIRVENPPVETKIIINFWGGSALAKPCEIIIKPKK